MRLTLYVCLAGVALRIERCEGKVEVMLGRLAGIDGAARVLGNGPALIWRVHYAELRSRGVWRVRCTDALAPQCSMGTHDAAFNPDAGRPLRPVLLFLLWRAGVPLPRARAKKRGPLQAVPVMVRAMAERLE